MKSLQAKRDAGQGADHVRYSDELRPMKGNDIILAQAATNAKKEYDAWHERYMSQPGIKAKVAEVESEISRVEAQIREIEMSR